MLALALVVAQVFVLPQSLFLQAGERAQRPAEVMALLDQARALPAEFYADALLRVADSSFVKDASWKKELIEEAFWSGSRAFLPYMQRVGRGMSDSVDFNAFRANRLEAVSLQTRAVRQMLSVNPEKARRLFDEISPIVLPQLACSNAATPDLVDYYQTAVFVFLESYTAKQRANGDDRLLLRKLVSAIEAPAQVPPALEMVFAVKLVADQRRDLMSLFAARLQEISRSDREYSAAEIALVSALDSGNLRPQESAIFLTALRTYIVRHVGGRRCTENLPAAGKMASSVEEFNHLIAKLDRARSRFKPFQQRRQNPPATMAPISKIWLDSRHSLWQFWMR